MQLRKVVLEARNDPKKSSVQLTSVADNSADASSIDFGQLNERLGYALRRAQIAVFQDFDATFGEVDIRPVQYSILTIIENNPGLSQTRVSDALGIKKPNFVAMLDILQGRRLVRRAPTPGDRRTYALFLTDEGRVFMRKLHKLAARHERNIIEMLGRDMHECLSGQLRLLGSLGKHR